MTEEQVEQQARLLWEQREAHIARYMGIKPVPWEEATEPSRELMRQYARAGVTDWLKAQL